MSPAQSTTIVVVPRERFAGAPESLESVIATAGSPHALIYVDAGAPAPIARRLAEAARRHDFTLIRTDRYLTPNQARNLALPMLKTRYAAFVDNDVVGAPGWLAALERCAEETGADIVAPLTCIGKPLHSIIHHAGGLARFVPRDGKRVFEEKHRLISKPVGEHRQELVRERTEMAEFHCVLVRTEIFSRIGKLDEGLMASHEHVDLCLAVAKTGGRLYFEPDAMITYVPARLSPRELPFFMLRWSDEWSKRTVEHFFAKWNAVDALAGGHTRYFVWHHRGHGMPKFRKRAMRIGGFRIGKFVIDSVERALAAMARRRFPEVGSDVPFAVIHAPRAAGSRG